MPESTPSMGPGGNALDDRYAINAAKAKLREGYNDADSRRILLPQSGYIGMGWPEGP
jgi:hypothetical protein